MQIFVHIYRYDRKPLPAEMPVSHFSVVCYPCLSDALAALRFAVRSGRHQGYTVNEFVGSVEWIRPDGSVAQCFDLSDWRC